MPRRSTRPTHTHKPPATQEVPPVATRPSLVPMMPAVLAVTPKEARRMLSIGERQLYELIMRKEIVSYTSGRSRRIPVAAIEAYIQERVAACMG